MPTADLIASEPGLADQLSDDPASITPVEQELPADRELEDLLTEIVWPDTVAGCAAVVERIMLPPEAEASLPDDPDELLAASRPTLIAARCGSSLQSSATVPHTAPYAPENPMMPSCSKGPISYPGLIEHLRRTLA